jgi:uncharacterized sporulation protein YeaH/YhbH (DUF444 family)
VSLKIDQDHGRFRQIVRGKIRENLKKYISHGELIGRKGKDRVSIPVPQIDIPRFRFGEKQTGGVAQGEGNPGDEVGQGDEQEGEGGKKAGKDSGEHALEVDVTLDELAAILGEELELPDIQNKGKSRISAAREKYSGIRKVGPESLRHFKRTYREALKRSIAVGDLHARATAHRARARRQALPLVEDQHRAGRQRGHRLHDGCVGLDGRRAERDRAHRELLDRYLALEAVQGPRERAYIIHDAVAREVDRETFFHTRESGGTMISSAYKLCAQIIEKDYPSDEWNIYPFHFSDGDNWSLEDTLSCIELLKKHLLDKINMFAYGQVESPYGSGQFIKDLREHLGKDERVVTSEIRDKDAITQSIKDFLGRGR